MAEVVDFSANEDVGEVRVALLSLCHKARNFLDTVRPRFEDFSHKIHSLESVPTLFAH
jgi:hypothetical protein